jgi:acyl-coenzyme A synthetase/AMP-(fatty) acid ligase
VGYGYLGDQERTEKAFVQNPASRFPDRLYRTGDLVHIREDGHFMFLGRADQQIKYLGHRIELGEIEAQLQALPEVDEAVVVFRQGEEASEQGIGALVSVRDGIQSGDVLAALKHRVPAYMLPRRILCTQRAFPRTPNGKYDRRAILSAVFE